MSIESESALAAAVRAADLFFRRANVEESALGVDAIAAWNDAELAIAAAMKHARVAEPESIDPEHQPIEKMTPAKIAGQILNLVPLDVREENAVLVLVGQRGGRIGVGSNIADKVSLLDALTSVADMLRETIEREKVGRELLVASGTSETRQ